MIVISSVELRDNMQKYLDLAKKEKVLIREGNTDIFVLSQEKYLLPDEDLARSISMDELLAGTKEDIREIFRTRE